MDIPFDKYTYHARLLPVLITFVPIGLGLAAWFPGQIVMWKLCGALFISFGFTALLSQLGRDLGKSKEPLLFQMWGGVPTTRLLSQRLSTIDSTTLKRYYAKLRVLLPGLNIPELTDEVRNPSAANQVYSSCVLFLRENTRDRKRFPLVYAENVNYGFRRNLWALKRLGTWSSAFGTISCTLSVILKVHPEPSSVLFGAVGGFVSGALLFLWLFVFNPNWIRIPAYAYAERLLGSLDNMSLRQSSCGPLNSRTVTDPTRKIMAATAIHPGDHLAEELKTLDMSAAELARKIRIPTNRVTQILHGVRPITGDTALRLAHFFCTSPEFWLNLQNLYELRIAQQKVGKAIKGLPTLKHSERVSA